MQRSLLGGVDNVVSGNQDYNNRTGGNVDKDDDVFQHKYLILKIDFASVLTLQDTSTRP